VRINSRPTAAPAPSANIYLAAATRIVVGALTDHLPWCLTPSVYTATMGQLRGL
jgi:hypothetical protein